ncbi:Fcf2-domain-containing protein [Meira miltonrushii]|uniref:Fcf2-domain-containing protein n=1 Tax=Meira miltonrushii TaxID=1280837 RepID=A0A316VCV0_9BASI|nr:Fcf2-domain-containing protein [Meira miltonrushii]PWN35366.1 Fcf2-domain-containing protein [Meira miltonrushii]
MQRDGREERTKSTGSKWFDMPAFAGANTGKNQDDERALINPKGKDGDGRGRSAEEMRREVQAIRLRNAVDPKRFYRGSARGEMDMPKYAQLGKIISGNADAASTMTRDQRGKSVIDELVKDAESSAYAKRKFNEQQVKSNVGWSSHVRRHQKKKGGVSNKRQRR